MLPATILAPNTLIQERYRIVRLMGRGGMGAVYKAVDTRLKTPVALKQTLVSGAQFTKAFRREAQLLASLRHPVLPVVSDYFTEANQQFLVMQFIPGPDLATLLAKQNRPFPLNDVLDWADHLLHALAYLHRQQPPVIHRDIKPQNLKLSEDGAIVLLDFGLAKGAAVMQTQMITSRSIRGYTPNYAPLEQIRGNITDQRSDLFSLAATMYHLLSNTPPLSAIERAESLINNQIDPLPPLHELNPLIPTEISALLMRALALPTADRPSNALEMRAALQEACGAEIQPGITPNRGLLVIHAPHQDAPSLTVPRLTTEVTALNREQATIHQISTIHNQPQTDGQAVPEPASTPYPPRPIMFRRNPLLWVLIGVGVLTMALSLPALGSYQQFAAFEPTAASVSITPLPTVTSRPPLSPSLPIQSALVIHNMPVRASATPTPTATIKATVRPRPRTKTPTNEPTSQPVVVPTLEPAPPPSQVPPTPTKRPKPDPDPDTEIIPPSSTPTPIPLPSATPRPTQTVTAYPVPSATKPITQTATLTPPSTTPTTIITTPATITATPATITATPATITATSTATPTPEPTAAPTLEPTLEPTAEPTLEPTAEPTYQPREQPTVEVSQQPPSAPHRGHTSVP